MKEIKYRAWNKETKIMQKVDAIDWGDGVVRNTGIGKIFRIYTGGYHFRDDEKRIGWGNIEALILMQYTGRKDIDGVEIFDGDILCFMRKAKSKNSAVRWHEKKCGWRVKVFGGDDTTGWNVIDEKHKIIGNIHENKELLS